MRLHWTPEWSPTAIACLSLATVAALAVAFLLFTPRGRKLHQIWLVIAAIALIGSAGVAVLAKLDLSEDSTHRSSGSGDDK